MRFRIGQSAVCVCELSNIQYTVRLGKFEGSDGKERAARAREFSEPPEPA